MSEDLKSKEIFFTLANALTFLRALSAFPIVIAIQSKSSWIYPLIIFGIVSDMMDGYLARRNDAVSRVGCVLDPTADFLVIMAVMSYFYIHNIIHPFIWWFMVCRYFLIGSVAWLLWLRYDIIAKANQFGKISIVFTAGYGICLIFGANNNLQISLMTLMLITQIISCWFYLTCFIDICQKQEYIGNNVIN